MFGSTENHDSGSVAEGTVLVPDTIPLFPLPRTVLLPGELLPLHVFEERYRAMVREAVVGHRVIGIVAVAPGHEEEHLDAPPLEEVGCVGFVAQHRELDDGRFLIWLVGLEVAKHNLFGAGMSYQHSVYFLKIMELTLPLYLESENLAIKKLLDRRRVI